MTIADDAVADDKSKAGAGADGFRGKKRFEHPRLNFLRNALAIVHDLHEQLVVFHRGADADFPGAIGRRDRVVDQIGPDLI